MKALELAKSLDVSLAYQQEYGRRMATLEIAAAEAAAELRRLAEVNTELLGALEAIKRLYRGGAFDLTDSPKSFISTVIRLCEESEQAIAKAKEQQ